MNRCAISGMRYELSRWAVSDRSTVSLAAVLDASHLDGILATEIEEHPVIATAEAETSSWRLQLLNVAHPVSKVAVDTQENLHCSLSVNRTNIGTGFGRSDDRDTAWLRFFAH